MTREQAVREAEAILRTVLEDLRQVRRADPATDKRLMRVETFVTVALATLEEGESE